MRSGAHRVARRRPGPDVEICLLKSSIGAELAFHLGHDPPGQQADADGGECEKYGDEKGMGVHGADRNGTVV